MLAKSFVIFWLLAVGICLHEEFTPTRTYEDDLDSDECNVFHTEVRLNRRTIGYLGFDGEEDSSLVKTREDAGVFHFDRKGSLRHGTSFVGSSRTLSKRGISTIKRLPRSPEGAWYDGAGPMYSSSDFTYGKGEAVFCYSRVDKKIYGQFQSAAPSSCQAITLTKRCLQRRKQPNPSSGPTGPGGGGGPGPHKHHHKHHHHGKHRGGKHHGAQNGGAKHGGAKDGGAKHGGAKDGGANHRGAVDGGKKGKGAVDGGAKHRGAN